jgi:Rrf2 family iron-sulfur cluster assembly transcriptional regulator
MKLTSKGRYAVMAMVDLAKNNAKKPINLTEISLRQGISISFLEQIFLKLKKNNLVKSSRGPSGGYILSKSPAEITLSSVIKAVDETIKTIGCIKDSKKGCQGKSTKCMTHNLWSDLETYINNFFEKNTLKDIVYGVNKDKQRELSQ